jgi:hypothetical protein
MTEVHQASLRPGRKPIKKWASDPDEQARIEAMLAKCKRRAEPKAEPPPPEPPTSPSTVEPQICWTRTGTHEMTSVCESYQILRRASEEARGIPPRRLYECWFRVPGYWYYRIGPSFPSYEAAQDHCEKHRVAKSLK